MSRVNVTVKEAHTKPMCLLKRLVQIEEKLGTLPGKQERYLEGKTSPIKGFSF